MSTFPQRYTYYIVLLSSSSHEISGIFTVIKLPLLENTGVQHQAMHTLGFMSRQSASGFTTTARVFSRA